LGGELSVTKTFISRFYDEDIGGGRPLFDSISMDGCYVLKISWFKFTDNTTVSCNKPFPTHLSI